MLFAIPSSAESTLGDLLVFDRSLFLDLNNFIYEGFVLSLMLTSSLLYIRAGSNIETKTSDHIIPPLSEILGI